jgi:hypothetical protein
MRICSFLPSATEIFEALRGAVGAAAKNRASGNPA